MSVIARIRWRLTLAYVGVLAVILGLFAAVVLVGFWEVTVRAQDDLLVQRAEELVRTGRDGGSLGDATLDNSDDYAWIAFQPGGRTLGQDSTAASFGLPLRTAVQAASGGPEVVEAQGAGGVTVRVATVAVPDGSGSVASVVQVARTLAAERASVRRLVLVLLPVGAGSLVLAALGGLVVSRRAMRPVEEGFERQRAFVADASHELKTPIALARLDAEVLQRDPTVEDAPRILAHQIEELDRTSTLLTELLTLARLDAGTLPARREPMDLAVLLAQTAARFRDYAAGGGVRIEVRTDGGVPACGDPDMTAQVLTGLLDNAVRHTPRGGSVVLTGRLAGQRAEAVVSDTGDGIPAEHLSRVFDRFARAQEARTRQGGNAGLGLAIARDLARAQGGDLTAHHGETGGAVLRLTLPRR